MLMIAFPAAAFATNCYVVAQGPGQECLVVDPGIGVVETLRDVFSEHRLRPAAVLLTHGHLDHVYSVTPVCRSTAPAVLPAYIHADDRYRLADPISLLGPGLVGMFEQQFGAKASWTEPDDIVTVTDGAQVSIAGVELSCWHAPGHTEGSMMFGIDAVPDGVPADLDRTMVTGDVVFAGSIGRTDLSGGSDTAMRESLRNVVLPLADSTLLLPGHGPATTMKRERATNPYLQGLGA
ncbi:MAG: MBL fold metallo-hydrolase [Dermatophilaceae bacterium]